MKDGRNIVLWCFLACFIILNAVSLWFQHQNTQEMLRILDYQKMIMTLPHGIAEKDPALPNWRTLSQMDGTLLNLLITPEFFHGRELVIEGYARHNACWDVYMLEEYAVYDFRDYSIRLSRDVELPNADPEKCHLVSLRGYFDLGRREFCVTRVLNCKPLKCELKPSLRAESIEISASEGVGED